MLKNIKQNIIHFDGDYIAHQCNATSKKASGLALDIFRAYPDSNIYADRQNPSLPGTIIIKGKVINMIAQYYPGPSNDNIVDNDSVRLNYFSKCLNEISKLSFSSIAFPYRIGCGLAGGSWDDYYKLINDWSENVSAEVYICKL